MNADLRHYTVLTFICCGGMFILAGSDIQAHPSSHVDAWARIGTDLDIRVTLFLDHVLASQNVHSPDDNSPVPVDVVRSALERFAGTLPALLLVFDADGRRLQGHVSERPRWKPAGRGIDLQADAGLRLTWQLRYPWAQTNQWFSIRHSFVKHGTREPAARSELEAGPTVPTELRLRVRSEVSGRRVDTVIASHQPHTIVLPDESSGSTSQQNRTPATARFVVLPRLLVHEFTIPLVLVSDAIRHSEQQLNSESHHPTVDADTTCNLAAAWIQHEFELLIDGQLSVPHATHVDLLTADNEQIEDPHSIPLIGTRLGIRTTHRLDHAPRNAAVSWRNSPLNIMEVQIHTVHGQCSASRVVGLYEAPVEDTLNYECNLTGTAFPVAHRDVPTPSAPGGMTMTHGADVDLTHHQLWPGQTRELVFRWFTWVVLVVAGAGSITGFLRNRWSWVNTAMITLVAVAVVLLVMPHRALVPDPESAKTLLCEMLNRTYRAVLETDEQTAVEQLSEVLTDDMVESVFQQITGSTADGPFVRVRDVQIVTCTPQRFVYGERAWFRCQWQIDGEIVHWGHRHQRNMLHSGILLLESTDRGCRIADIRTESVEIGRDSGRS